MFYTKEYIQFKIYKKNLSFRYYNEFLISFIGRAVF
jgi:hypothetical protein